MQGIYLHENRLSNNTVMLIYNSYVLTMLNICQDTFRGRVCECPLVDGVQFKGDGYTTCEGEMALSFTFMHAKLISKGFAISVPCLLPSLLCCVVHRV
jgi:hypothetical protein